MHIIGVQEIPFPFFKKDATEISLSINMNKK